MNYREPTGRLAAARLAQRLFAEAVVAFSDDPGPANLERYLVANRALDVLRAERRLSDEELPDLPDLAPSHEGGDRSLLTAVAGLSLERRVVVVLRYGVGMTPKQIADALDLPVGTVNSRLARALEQLRESLEVEHVE